MHGRTRQKGLILILARDLASRLATPAFLVDGEGTLVYFNEAAEGVFGRTWAECGEMSKEEWSTAFSPVDDRGRPLSLKELPLGIALLEGKPAHRRLSIRDTSGVERELAVTGLPLYAREDDLEGAISLFWEESAL